MGNRQKEGTSNNEPMNNMERGRISEISSSKVAINRNSFEFLHAIGRGGFGKVWKVTQKKYKKVYALKEMSKAKVIDKRSERSIKAERELLSQLRHPFIVNMYYAFQDTHNLYLVMDLLTGGDMRYHLSNMNRKKLRFTEDQASKSK